MLNATVMLLLPDVYGSIGTIDQTFGAQSTEYRFLLKKMCMGQRFFQFVLIKPYLFSKRNQLQWNNYCFSRNMYSFGFVTLCSKSVVMLRYGNGNVPSTKCIAKHGRRFQTEVDPQGITGFENRHLYVEHTCTKITPAKIAEVMQLIRESYDQVINYVWRSIYLKKFLALLPFDPDLKLLCLC